MTQSAQWGRSWIATTASTVSCLLIFLFSPILVMYFYIAAFHFNASLLAPLELSFAELWQLTPNFTWDAFIILAVWFALQLVLALVPDGLHKILPRYLGGMRQGALTPAGNRLLYNINGLQAWCVAQLLFVVATYGLNWFSPTIIFDHFGGLLIAMNIIGFSTAIFAYVKGYLFPSHPEDRKFSGSLLYDFYMGIEQNPRVGRIDLKLFFNGRPGIVAWTLINLSFTAEQYVRYGYVTNSMILVNIFQGLYVLYFFWKEAWYLNTIDIAHDHFGWMLAWGDCVWLPYMYTLQGLFLVFHPVELTTSYALFVLAFGLIGFTIFVSANNQKDRFKRLGERAVIWGKEPKVIPCEYRTQDGDVWRSNLLTSGWWGVSRHMNYTGDLILSLAYSLACGFEYLLPYFYFVFMMILLIHRCIRDEHRCNHKYGPAWRQYCTMVPYRLFPGVF